MRIVGSQIVVDEQRVDAVAREQVENRLVFLPTVVGHQDRAALLAPLDVRLVAAALNRRTGIADRVRVYFQRVECVRDLRVDALIEQKRLQAAQFLLIAEGRKLLLKIRSRAYGVLRNVEPPSSLVQAVAAYGLGKEVRRYPRALYDRLPELDAGVH